MEYPGIIIFIGVAVIIRSLVVIIGPPPAAEG